MAESLGSCACTIRKDAGYSGHLTSLLQIVAAGICAAVVTIFVYPRYAV